jgi:hypothetical protein
LLLLVFGSINHFILMTMAKLFFSGTST